MMEGTDSVKAWRKRIRSELVGKRTAVEERVREEWGKRIDEHLERAFPQLQHARVCVGVCWPWRGEYDARPYCARLRQRGATTALPVVVAPGQPLLFRLWDDDSELGEDTYGIPYPLHSPQVHPDALLIPMNAFDDGGYRLGYGGGFFDRTLASLSPRPLAIGIAFELARVDTLQPQPHDIPMDYVVTEAAVYRRAAGRLEPLTAPLHAA